MKYTNVKDIQNEVVNIVTGLYLDEIKMLNERTLPDQFENIYETLSFIFEDFREDFARIKRLENKLFVIEKNVEVEMKLFNGWSTLHVLERLKNEMIDLGNRKMEKKIMEYPKMK